MLSKSFSLPKLKAICVERIHTFAKYIGGLRILFFQEDFMIMRPIFCGNLEFDTRQSDVERLFRRYGRVDRVDMKSGKVAFYFSRVLGISIMTPRTNHTLLFNVTL